MKSVDRPVFFLAMEPRLTIENAERSVFVTTRWVLTEDSLTTIGRWLITAIWWFNFWFRLFPRLNSVENKVSVKRIVQSISSKFDFKRDFLWFYFWFFNEQGLAKEFIILIMMIITWVEKKIIFACWLSSWK